MLIYLIVLPIPPGLWFGKRKVKSKKGFLQGFERIGKFSAPIGGRRRGDGALEIWLGGAGRGSSALVLVTVPSTLDYSIPFMVSLWRRTLI